MTGTELELTAKLSLLEFIVEGMLAQEFAIHSNQETFEKYRANMMNLVQYQVRVSAQGPGADQAGLMIQSRMIALAEALFARVESRMKGIATQIAEAQKNQQTDERI